MKKLQDKLARQSPERKPKSRRDEMHAPRPVPFEPVPLHIPVQVPQPPSNGRREESISEPRGVVVIDYGSD